MTLPDSEMNRILAIRVSEIGRESVYVVVGKDYASIGYIASQLICQ